MAIAYLSLGSNVEPERRLAAAITALRAQFPTTPSRAYRMPAVGFSGADFVNAAARVETVLSLDALAAWLRTLEDQQGRDRSGPRFGDRSLDIDIVLYDDLVVDAGGKPRIPRPELSEAFVLKPLAEIAPDVVVPGAGRTLAELWRVHPAHETVFDVVTLPI